MQSSKASANALPLVPHQVGLPRTQCSHVIPLAAFHNASTHVCGIISRKLLLKRPAFSPGPTRSSQLFVRRDLQKGSSCPSGLNHGVGGINAVTVQNDTTCFTLSVLGRKNCCAVGHDLTGISSCCSAGQQLAVEQDVSTMYKPLRVLTIRWEVSVLRFW